MTQSSQDSWPTQGLRARKKAKTRAAIQRHALRLFRTRGYAATTVEQIAAAAEVSPSTFFRYFPTKEDVVLYDAFDPMLTAAFAAQPATLTPIQAIREAMHATFATMSAEDLKEQWERGALVFSVADLRQRALDDVVAAAQQLAEIVAKRVGRRADELPVRTFVGAVIGALMAAFLAGAGDPKADFVALIDASLTHLEAGLPL